LQFGDDRIIRFENSVLSHPGIDDDVLSQPTSARPRGTAAVAACLAVCGLRPSTPQWTVAVAANFL